MQLKRFILSVIIMFCGYSFAQEVVFVKMETSMGDIVLELDEKHAPNTVKNFIEYVEDDFYSGLIFHRVIPGFMVQGGGFDINMKQKEVKAPIAIESKNGLKNLKGSIAMARTMDPNSATSQFFINSADNTFLDYPGQDGFGYTVFGKVVSGMDVVEVIEKANTTTVSGNADVPIDNIVIKQVTLIDKP